MRTLPPSVWLCILVLSTFSTVTNAQVKSSTVQSILLYSALKYMEWPVDESSEFSITIIGDIEMYEELAKVAQTRKLGTRNIIVRKASSLADINGTPQLVFLGSATSNQLEKALEAFKTRSILIVTQEEGFLEKGSDLNFVNRDGKISFQLNEGTIAKKGIKVSTALSSMAEKRI